jgi:hypothetical protein
VARVSGKPYEIRNQGGYAHTVDKDGKQRPYPQTVEILLEKDQPAFAPGNYTVAASSLYVGEYNRLMLGRLVLVPISAKLAASA